MWFRVASRLIIVASPALIRSRAMSSTESNRFSAAGSALGYLAQVEYALLIALRRMDCDVELRLSIETADDITFDVEGAPLELWQTKHHVARHGSLGDASPDVWKTLHNWIETSGENTACFLLTTVAAPADSAASHLGTSRTAHDLLSAREKLDAVARAAGNTSSAGYYAKYLDLTDERRLELLSRVTILDGAVDAATLTDSLVGSVRKATTAQRRRPLVDRLRGWWHGRALSHLSRVAEGRGDWIELAEIEDRLLSIAQSLRDDNLPLDYANEPEPSQSAVDEDDRVFIEQLQLILLHHDRIRQAVYDHNRAFLQRSRWQREQLLAIGELDIYDRRLMEEWKRVFLPLEERPGDSDIFDENKLRDARQLYLKLQERTLPEIRAEVRSGYIPFGSLHILADRLQIGWHPDWIDLLKHRLIEARGAA